MSNYLTLTKDRTGVNTGTVDMFDGIYRVRITSSDKRYYRVEVVAETGALVGKGLYTLAGMLRRDGRYWHLTSYDADSKPGTNKGYGETGTMARNAERIVAEFLGAREYAGRRAAMTPEEKQAEVEERKAQIARLQREQIEKAARDLLALMDRHVDVEALRDPYVDGVVYGLRSSVSTMIRNLPEVPMTGDWGN